MIATSAAPRARVIAGNRMAMTARFATAEAEPTAGDADTLSFTDRLTLTARIRRFVTHRRHPAASRAPSRP